MKSKLMAEALKAFTLIGAQLPLYANDNFWLHFAHKPADNPTQSY